MLDQLGQAIDALKIPLDGAVLAEAIALRGRLDAKITETVAAFNAAELWDADAATSMTAWLRDRADLTHRSAHRLAVAADRLAQLPVTAHAYRAGALSGGQVEAIVGVLSSSTVGLFADHEAELIPTLSGLSATDTAAVMRAWKAHATADGQPPAEPERELHLSRVLDGRWALNGDLDPESGAIVDRAVRLAESPDVDGEPARAPARRRADSLVDICEFFLTWQQTQRGGRHRPHLNVVVNLDDHEAGRGGRVVDGPNLDQISIERLVCDSALHRVLMAGRSTILDYGTATRTIPAPLWNAVVIRDQGCRFPGCDRRPEWCQGPPYALVQPRRRHRHRQPRVGVQPPPPPATRARVGGQAQARRELRCHRSQRRPPYQPPTRQASHRRAAVRSLILGGHRLA